MKKSDFDKLKNEWYQKLKDSGFDDAENGSEELKVRTYDMLSGKGSSNQGGGWEAKASYYQMATNLLNDYKFETHQESLIWEYHSNAISIRDITKLLNQNLPPNEQMGKDTVWLIIKKLKSTMFDMYLMPKKEYRE
jgi:hypothetical protein